MSTFGCQSNILEDNQICANVKAEDKDLLKYPADVKIGGYKIGSMASGNKIQYDSHCGGSCKGRDKDISSSGEYCAGEIAEVCVPPTYKPCPFANEIEFEGALGDSVDMGNFTFFFNRRGIVRDTGWSDNAGDEYPHEAWAKQLSDIRDFQGTSNVRVFNVDPGKKVGKKRPNTDTKLRHVIWTKEDPDNRETTCIYDGNRIRPDDLEAFRGTNGYGSAGEYLCIRKSNTTNNCQTYNVPNVGQVTPDTCSNLVGTSQCSIWSERDEEGNANDTIGGLGLRKLNERANTEVLTYCQGLDIKEHPECRCINRDSDPVFQLLENVGAANVPPAYAFTPCQTPESYLIDNDVRNANFQGNICEEIINVQKIRNSDINISDIEQATGCNVPDNGGGGNDNGGGGNDNGGGGSNVLLWIVVAFVSLLGIGAIIGAVILLF